MRSDVFSAPKVPLYLIESMTRIVAPVGRDHQADWYTGGSAPSSGAALRADTHEELRVATREARTRLTAALGKEDTAGHHIATSAQGAALRAHLQRVAQAQQEQAPAS